MAGAVCIELCTAVTALGGEDVSATSSKGVDRIPIPQSNPYWRASRSRTAVTNTPMTVPVEKKESKEYREALERLNAEEKTADSSRPSGPPSQPPPTTRTQVPAKDKTSDLWIMKSPGDILKTLNAGTASADAPQKTPEEPGWGWLAKAALISSGTERGPTPLNPASTDGMGNQESAPRSSDARATSGLSPLTSGTRWRSEEPDRIGGGGATVERTALVPFEPTAVTAGTTRPWDVGSITKPADRSLPGTTPGGIVTGLTTGVSSKITGNAGNKTENPAVESRPPTLATVAMPARPVEPLQVSRSASAGSLPTESRLPASAPSDPMRLSLNPAKIPAVVPPATETTADRLRKLSPMKSTRGPGVIDMDAWRNR